MPAAIELLQKYEKLDPSQQASFLYAGLDVILKYKQAESRKIPPVYRRMRLLQICELYPMPTVVLDEDTGIAKPSRLTNWFSRGIHNSYSVTIIEGEMPIDNRIIVWLLDGTKYSQAFQIHANDGHDDSDAGRWFFSGMQNTLIEYSNSSINAPFPKDKLQIDDKIIQKNFIFRFDGKTDSDYKKKCWRRIKDNNLRLNKLNVEASKYLDQNIPFFFSCIVPNRPSEGLIINVAGLDISIIRYVPDIEHEV